MTPHTIPDFYINGRLPKGLLALGPKTLFDLYDIALKWGVKRIDENGEFFAIKIGLCANNILFNIIGRVSGRERLVIFKSSARESDTKRRYFLTLNMRNGKKVLWDPQISLLETLEIIRTIDNIFGKESGWEESGERIRPPEAVLELIHTNNSLYAMVILLGFSKIERLLGDKTRIIDGLNLINKLGQEAKEAMAAAFSN